MEITDLSRGQVSVGDAQFIPKGAVRSAVNCEYNKSPLLTRRKDPEIFSSFTADIGAVENFSIWFPPNRITGAISEYIIVYFKSNSLFIAKEIAENSWESVPVVITGVKYNENSSLTFFTSKKLLIADTQNRSHYIEIDKDGNVVSGILGIPAPTSKIVVSGASADNEYVETVDSEAEKGMGIEKGSILQLVYTVVDKFGNESNPSPITTYTNLAYRDLTTTDYAPFKYWWAKAKYSNLEIPENLDNLLIKNLERFKIYRRHLKTLEDNPSNLEFRLVDSVEILSKDSGNSYTDALASGSELPSYENDIAPIGKFIAENSQVKFIANLKTNEAFPITPYYKEIKLLNKNAKTYVNAPIMTELTDSAIFDGTVFSGTGDFSSHADWKNHIRFFADDRITPLPCVLKGNKFFVLVPLIPEISNTSIFLCFDKYVDGAWLNEPVRASWRSPLYGEFVSATDPAEWATQKVFYPIRPRTTHAVVCCSNEYHADEGVENRANGSADGDFNTAEWILNNMEYLRLDNEILLLPFSSTDDKNATKIVFSADGSKNITFTTKQDEMNKGTISFFWHTIGTAVSGTDLVTTAIVKLYKDSDNYITISAVYNPSTLKTRFKAVAVNSTGAMSFSTVYMTISGYNFICLSWNGTKATIKAFNRLSNELYVGETSSFKIPSGEHDMILTCDGTFNNSFIDSIFSQFNYDSNIYVDTDDDFFQLMNFSPYFPTEWIGYNTTDGENKNIELKDTEEDIVKDEKNLLKWSPVNGLNFPDLWERHFREPIKGIIPLNRKTELTTENTLLVFGRNTLNVFRLSGEPDEWVDSTENIIEEYTQFGILSERSLGKYGNIVFWMSELGAMLFDGTKPIPISQDKISIPLKNNIIGFPIPLREQYVFYSPDDNMSYVYHVMRDAWTVFTGLDIEYSQVLSGGSELRNKNIFMKADGSLDSYPSDTKTTEAVLVTTGQFQLNNNWARRFKIDYDGAIEASVMVKNRSVTNTKKYNTMLWHTYKGIPLEFWGELIWFTLTRFDTLKMIEFDPIRR